MSEANPAPKAPRAVKRLLNSNKPVGDHDAVARGGTEVTPHQAEKIIGQLKEEAREDAKGGADKENAVEKVLGELTGQ